MFSNFVPSQSPSYRTLTIVLASILVFTVPLITLSHFKAHPCFTAPQATKLSPNVHALFTDDHLLDTIGGSSNFAYFPSADLLLASVAKGGSTSVFQWLYRGITGDEGEHSYKRCGSNVQDLRSDCWQSRATYLQNFTRERRLQILTSPSTLRMAVQRDPFERLISAFNDKFACVTDDFNAGLAYSIIVPYVRELAGMAESPRRCMNVSEFATALDTIREKQSVPLQELDVHIRPQQLYFDYIPYDVVLDVNELSNSSVLGAVLERLPFREKAADGIGHQHAVHRAELMIPESAAKKLHRFAMESHVGERRHGVSS